MHHLYKTPFSHKHISLANLDYVACHSSYPSPPENRSNMRGYVEAWYYMGLQTGPKKEFSKLFIQDFKNIASIQLTETSMSHHKKVRTYQLY